MELVIELHLCYVCVRWCSMALAVCHLVVMEGQCRNLLLPVDLLLNSDGPVYTLC
jgi:hypothetical protein